MAKKCQSTMSISGAVKDRPNEALQGSRALIWELGSLEEPEPLGLMPSRTTARLIRFDVAQRHNNGGMEGRIGVNSQEGRAASARCRLGC